MSLGNRTASLRSTSSGGSGQVSSTPTPLTGDSIRSQVKKKKDLAEESVIVLRGAKYPRGVCLMYEVTSKGRVLLTYGQNLLIHADRRAHTGSKKPQQQIASEIIYIWLRYALCVRVFASVLTFFFPQTNSKITFSFPKAIVVIDNETRIATNVLEGRGKSARG